MKIYWHPRALPLHISGRRCSLFNTRKVHNRSTHTFPRAYSHHYQDLGRGDLRVVHAHEQHTCCHPNTLSRVYSPRYRDLDRDDLRAVRALETKHEQHTTAIPTHSLASIHLVTGISNVTISELFVHSKPNTSNIPIPIPSFGVRPPPPHTISAIPHNIPLLLR